MLPNAAELARIAKEALDNGEPPEVCDAKAHAAANAWRHENKPPETDERYWHIVALVRAGKK
jgi:hypothetical protein